jgi:hypothetical protein
MSALPKAMIPEETPSLPSPAKRRVFAGRYMCVASPEQEAQCRAKLVRILAQLGRDTLAASKEPTP